jgi:hypothetical protein
MEAKATLEFNLPEQEWDFKYALSGLDALLTINDLDQELRSAMKHECGELSHYRDDETGERKKCCYETLELVRSKLWEIHNKYKLPELI